MVWQEENTIKINYSNTIIMENASRVQHNHIIRLDISNFHLPHFNLQSI